MKETFFTIEVRDKEGKLLKRIRRKSRSYVQQWNELVCAQVGQKDDLSMKDTGGVARAINSHAVNFRVTAAITQVTYGIVVGTGSAAVAIDDYALATMCDEGTGENQLNYYACTVSDPSVSAPDCSFTITRSAINNSGAPIVVAEIGLNMTAYDTLTPYYFLGIRDVLVSSVEVPDGGAITVVYTIKVTV